MPSHTVERNARGVIQSISGTCGSDECPVEEHDEDDATITYSCPVTGDVIAEDDVGPADTEPANQPDKTDDLTGGRRRRRR
jgi:hypothetical protein